MFYLVAINEPIDNTDSAQVLVFIRAITGDFHCFEELFCLCTMMDRTRGIDIFNAFEVKQTRRPSGHQATNNGLSLHLVAFSVSVFSFR